MNHLFILNDSPYDSKRPFNALRLVISTTKKCPKESTVFLLGDGVVNGLRRESPADASYNTQEMLRLLGEEGVSIFACHTCLSARGIDADSLLACVRRSSLEELTALLEESESVLTF